MPVKLLPGEYRRRSIVTVEFDRMSGEIYAPTKLADLDARNPGRRLRDSVAVENNYILTAHRLDGEFDYAVELDGQVFPLPGKVIDRLIAMRQSIIAEGRKRQGQASAARRREKEREIPTEELDELAADRDFALVNGHKE